MYENHFADAEVLLVDLADQDKFGNENNGCDGNPDDDGVGGDLDEKEKKPYYVTEMRQSEFHFSRNWPVR